MITQLYKIVNKETRLCAGVMSGTSLDGIDIAFCEITGHGRTVSVQLRYFETVPYADADRARLLRACAPETSTVEDICILNKTLGKQIGVSVAEAAQRAGIALREIDFISSHGQTVYHAPAAGATLQIGDLAEIAAVTGAITVGDFRPSDMAYGGEGAPLVPYVDDVLYRSETVSRVLVNIGGMANLTALCKGGGEQETLAFDTGPGNVLADHLVRLHCGGELLYDEGGEIACSGSISKALLESLAQEDSFIKLPPPKSTGREQYTAAYAAQLLARGQAMKLSFADILATVTDFTAFSLAQAIHTYVGFLPDEIYVSGGGWHNRFLRQRLESRLGQSILPAEALGCSTDAKEAAAFAVLGNAFLFGEVNHIPGATGASRGVIMGKLALPSGGPLYGSAF